MRWWRYGAFGFGFPPFFFFRFGPGRFGPWGSRAEYRRFLEDYLQDLERHKREVEEEIAAVKRELEELGE
ncbi:MAG: hypothetical protein ACUVQS_06105 [Candidatus Bipolaricaulaceae bacterium]